MFIIMAGFALQSLVLARERKIRLLVVIKLPLHPTDGVVAGIASCAKRLLVWVVLMALMTSLWRTAKM